MNVVGYARVVPSETAAEALNHQRVRLKAFCKENRLHLKEVFTETVSGDLRIASGRPALRQAIDACASGMALLVIRLDRLSGQKAILKTIFEVCTNKGVKIIAMQGPQTPESIEESLEVTVVPNTHRA